MTMRILAGLALALWPLGAGAGEHPKEHPTAQQDKKGHEHPKGHEDPKAHEHPTGHEHPVGSKAWTKQMSGEFTKAVEQHVAEKSADLGAFKVSDEKLGKDWALKLVGVHKKRVAHLGDGRFFACADFKPVAKGSKDKVDLDFYATKKDDGGWTIDKVLIHKVNGKPRYTYNEKNEIVPVE